MIYIKRHKKIVGYIGIILVSIFVASCSDFLNTTPKSQVGVNSFYETSEDFEQAVNSTYAALEAATNGSFSYFFLLTDLRSDNTTNATLGGAGTGPKQDIDAFETNPTNESLRSTYSNSYVAIGRANEILSRIDGFDDLDQATKDQYKGEVKAIRAYLYFNLVRFFGKVPLVLRPFENLDNTYNVERSSVDDVYAQIILDLTEAAELLPLSYSGSDVGRVTEGAARSILGTVYLTRKNYSNAVTEFQRVINSQQYQLLSNYEEVFDGDNQGHSEAIWQILYKNGGDGIGNGMAQFHAPNGSSTILENGTAYGWNQPTQDIADAYEENDLRKDVSIAEGYTNADGQFVPAKYVKYYAEAPVDNNGDSSTDWNIIRYADVLLRCAEAINEMNQGPTPESYNYLNMVRNRAGLPSVDGLTYESFRSAVYHEQRVESPFEGKRWFDLIRTDRAIDVMNSKISEPGETTTVGITNEIQEYQLIYPIPEEVIEISRNIIEQNPGY